MLYSEHAHAFRAWHVAHLKRTSRHWEQPPLMGNAVEPRLIRFRNHLKLRVERDAVFVSAEWDWETWDVPFAAEARIKIEDGWYSSEWTPGDLSSPIEALWEKHLYNRLLDWAELVLAPSRTLYFCESERTKWAVLTRDVGAVPEHAVYAIYEGEMA